MSDPIPLEDYYRYTTVSAVRLSPDGETLAFVTRESDGDEDEVRNSLFVVPTSGARAPHRLTRASDAGSPRFSPDGSKLGFVAAREEDVELAVAGEDSEPDDGDGSDDTNDNGDDGPEPQVWVFDLERGGDARQITTFEHGVGEFDWGPRGERLVVESRDPTEAQAAYLEQREEGGPIETERLQHKYDGTGWLDTVRTYLFVVDVDDRSSRRLDDAHDGGGIVAPAGGLSPRWSPDGETIAFRSNRAPRPDDEQMADLYTVSVDGEALTRHTDGTGMVGSLVWAPAGDRLAYTHRDADNWYLPTECHVTDLEDSWSVTAPLDRTIARAGVRWLDDDRLLAAIGDEGHTRLVTAEGDGSGVSRTFEAQRRDRALEAFDVAGDTVAAVCSQPSEGVDCFAFEADSLETSTETAVELERLTALNDDLLESWPEQSCTRIHYESADGTEIEAIAYLPPDATPETAADHPLVVSIHGGPMAYDEPDFSFQAHLFTSRGYVVLQPNYRGSTSYGRDFCTALRGRWNSIEVEDILAGVDAVVDRGWVDPERLFCTGFSQGGVNTAFAITKTDRFAAAAAEHGIYDMYATFGTDDCHNWWESDYGLPWDHPESYREASSIDDVAAIETPLLVTAGEADWRCPPSQSEQLYVSLRKQDVPAKLVVYPDEHHNVGDPDRAVHRFEELLEWFERFDPAVENEDDEAETTGRHID